MKIGKIIKECRISQKLSQTEVAKRSGLSLSTVHGIECGENKEPSFNKIASICGVLHFSLDKLAQMNNCQFTITDPKNDLRK